MRFDVDRLSKLAGIQGGKRSSLNEASNRSYHDDDTSDDADWRFGKNQLAEQDDPDGGDDDPKEGRRKKKKKKWWGDKEGEDSDTGKGEDYVAEVWGKKDLEWGDPEEGPPMEEAGWTEEMGSVDELNDPLWLGEDGEPEPDPEDGNQSEEVVLEIDEDTLRQEVRRMQAERLQENRLRTAIRNEIRDIFRSAGVAGPSRSGSDSNWIYGDNQPKNSRDGYVVTPGTTLPGFGFK